MRTRIISASLITSFVVTAALSVAVRGPTLTAQEKDAAKEKIGGNRNRSAAARDHAGARDRVVGKDDEGLRQALQSYGDAFNKGDVDAVMSYWSSDPEFVDEFGKSTRGKEALSALIQKIFDDHKGAKLKLVSKSTRFVKPDVAVQNGTVTLTAPDGMVDTGPYTSIWVRNDGRWQIAQVRDLPAEGAAGAAGNHDALKQLDWLVGTWASEGKEHPITLTCKWSKNQNYLLVNQDIRLKDDDVLELTHIIGWDPLHRQVRSWVFDSRGGFGEGMWNRSGNAWIVEASGVLADGRQASSRSTWKFLDHNGWEWTSTDREIDDRPMPDVTVRYVRKQSAPPSAKGQSQEQSGQRRPKPADGHE